MFAIILFLVCFTSIFVPGYQATQPDIANDYDNDYVENESPLVDSEIDVNDTLERELMGFEVTMNNNTERDESTPIPGLTFKNARLYRGQKGVKIKRKHPKDGNIRLKQQEEIMARKNKQHNDVGGDETDEELIARANEMLTEHRRLNRNGNIPPIDGTKYIIFGCRRPSIYINRNEKLYLKNAQITKNQRGIKSAVFVDGQKHGVECDQPTNLWQYSDKRLVTIDKATRNTYGSYLSATMLRDALGLRRQWGSSSSRSSSSGRDNLIVTILKTFHHPRFY